MNLIKLKSKFSELETLDQQIKSIDRYARLIKDKTLDINLKMSFEKEKKDVCDDDGYEYKPTSSFFSIGIPSSFLGSEHSSKQQEIFNLLINEVMSLEILGVIVAHLESKRMVILKDLEQAGINIK